MSRHASIGLLLLVLGTAGGAIAQTNDFIGPRPLGMGGAHRAIVTGNDAIMLNPAGMSLFRRYAFEVQYLLAPELQVENGPAQHIITVSVVDNQVQRFATGMAYTRIQTKDGKSGNRYDLAFSAPVTDGLMIGADFKYLDLDHAGQPGAVEAVTLDVGLLFQTSVGMSLGVVGYNLTNTADYFDHPVSLGAAVMYSPFRTLELSFDWLIDFQKPRDVELPNGQKQTAYSYHFGAEYLLAELLTVRAGFSIDQIDPRGDQQYWSVGVGYVSERFAFDFGYRGSVDHSWDSLFGFALRFYL